MFYPKCVQNVKSWVWNWGLHLPASNIPVIPILLNTTYSNKCHYFASLCVSYTRPFLKAIHLSVAQFSNLPDFAITFLTAEIQVFIIIICCFYQAGWSCFFQQSQWSCSQTTNRQSYKCHWFCFLLTLHFLGRAPPSSFAKEILSLLEPVNRSFKKLMNHEATEMSGNVTKSPFFSFCGGKTMLDNVWCCIDKQHLKGDLSWLISGSGMLGLH